MKSGNFRGGRGLSGAIAALTALLMLTGSMTGSAQTAQGEPSDLAFEIINATSGEPGTVDKMVIEYLSSRRDRVAEFEPDGSTFTAYDVPIKEIGRYIVTVWYGGVPYWWNLRGQSLIEGTTTLHVFDTTSSLEGISISGLNLVVRREESLLRLEYMCQINNDAKPQVTVTGSPATFDFALPSGVTDINASYARGPDPTPVEVTSPGPQGGLAIPLTPGANQFRLVAVVPWTEGMELPVGTSLPLVAWSLLASPEWLEIGSTDVEENDREKVSGFRRFAGFPLEAGETVSIRLTSGEHGAGPEEDLFTQDSSTDQEGTDAGKEDDQGGGPPLPLIFLGVLIIVIILAARRRRS